jgi:hypothetical protein
MGIVRSTFFTQLKERLDKTVTVSYGPPPAAKKDHVLLSAETTGDITDALLKSGRRKWDEDYTFDVIVIAKRAKPEAAETRACEILAQVQDVLADTALLVLPEGVHALVPEGFEMESSYNEQDVITEIMFTIRAKARVT